MSKETPYLDGFTRMARQFEADQDAEKAVSDKAEELATYDYENAFHFRFEPMPGFIESHALKCMECQTEIRFGSSIIVHVEEGEFGVRAGEEWYFCSHCFMDNRMEFHTRELLEGGSR